MRAESPGGAFGPSEGSWTSWPVTQGLDTPLGPSPHTTAQRQSFCPTSGLRGFNPHPLSIHAADTLTN